jgi:hypothetical protein
LRFQCRGKIISRLGDPRHGLLKRPRSRRAAPKFSVQPDGRPGCPERFGRVTLSSLSLQATGRGQHGSEYGLFSASDGREWGRALGNWPSSWIASDSAFLERSIRILYATRSSPFGVKSPGQALTPSRAFLAEQGLRCPLVDHGLSARRSPAIGASAASCNPPHDGAVQSRMHCCVMPINQGRSQA